LFGQSPAIAGATPTVVKPIFQNIKLRVPANTIMRCAMHWTYTTNPTYQGSITLTSQTVSANGVDLLAGGTNGVSNHLRGSGVSANSTTYGWWGSITFEPAAIPCDDTTV